MFFKKKLPETPPVTASSVTPPTGEDLAQTRATQARARERNADAESGLLLDALGDIVSAFAHHPIDLPHRPADVTAREMAAWHRHTTLGQPVDERDEGAAAVGIGERDWSGLVRAITALRRDEQSSVESLVDELRKALWTCVSAVHEAVRIDDSAEATTGTHLALVRKAVAAPQLQTIKADVLSAVSEIDRALRERRDAQQRQYKTLATSLDSLGRQLEEAKREGATDPLTGVGNRKHFDLMLSRAIQMFSLGRAPVALLMIDLNKLKIINDSYGHTAGDAAISTVAQALKLVFLRQSDVVCRYGGDEFAVILNNCELRVAQTLAKRFLDQVKALPAPSQSMEFALGASVGIALLEPGEDAASWIARADHAMYEAKRGAAAGVMVADAINRTPNRERQSA